MTKLMHMKQTVRAKILDLYAGIHEFKKGY
jgi:hypothetical protein